MRSYFEKMTEFGKPLSDGLKQRMRENVQQIKGVEKEIAEAVQNVRKAGLPAEVLKKLGEWTVQMLEYLLDAYTWCRGDGSVYLSPFNGAIISIPFSHCHREENNPVLIIPTEDKGDGPVPNQRRYFSRHCYRRY